MFRIFSMKLIANVWGVIRLPRLAPFVRSLDHSLCVKTAFIAYAGGFKKKKAAAKRHPLARVSAEPKMSEKLVLQNETVTVTEDAYGVLYINSPEALFVDIDMRQHSQRFPHTAWATFGGCEMLLAVWFPWTGGVLALSTLILWLSIRWWAERWWAAAGVPQAISAHPMRELVYPVALFVSQHPGWHVRVYETPQGIRLLAMHRTFCVHEPITSTLMAQFGADPAYVALCQRRGLFSARVGAKLSRTYDEHGISLAQVSGDVISLRRKYAAQDTKYAACRYLGRLGGTHLNTHIERVQQMHDRLAFVNTNKPLA